MPAQVWIDGIEVTEVALDGSSTRRLNRPSVAQVRLPMESAIGDVGSRLKIAFDGDLHFHGTILLCETDTGEDVGYTVYNASDPLELWQWRPVREPEGCPILAPDPGDMTKPTIIECLQTGPQIVEGMMDASENSSLIPSKAEGPLFLARGSFAGGGVDLTGAPVDWPMTMAQLATLLVSTGEVDIIITPIDSGGNMGQIDVYNGNYGIDRSGSVIFQYAMGAKNVAQLRWNTDMSKMCNKLWYYLGPRVETPEDPAGDQHWRANITRDDPGLADPPQSGIVSLTNSSRSTYGVRMEVKIFDARGDEALVGRELYRRLWQIESWLRAQPLNLIHITPTRDAAIGDFDIGDLVTVEADPVVRGGFSGVQRIYEYTISWDTDGVLALSELQTSSDATGFDS